MLEKMKGHSKKLSKLRSIKRGKQFRAFCGGTMVGVGSREPAGGAPADAYRPYEGMTGSELEDIDLFFDHAEVCILY